MGLGVVRMASSSIKPVKFSATPLSWKYCFPSRYLIFHNSFAKPIFQWCVHTSAVILTLVDTHSKTGWKGHLCISACSQETGAWIGW